MDLQAFLGRYGTDETNNFQLLHWAKQLRIPNFQVLMKDEIKQIDNTKPIINLITNIQVSDEPGAHWSGFHKGPEGNMFGKRFRHYWYDSYGRPPDEEVIQQFGRGTILASDDQNQEFGTTYCGQLALYFLYCMNKGIPFVKIVSELKNADRHCLSVRQ